MHIIDQNSSLVYENREYKYNQIYAGCTKWLSVISADTKKVLIYSEVDEKVIFLILALLGTDCLYIPVDIKTPVDRVNNIIRQTDPDLVVTDRKSGVALEAEKFFFIEDYDNLASDGIFLNEWGNGAAYCIFTSGSTGVPKGVLVGKEAFQNFINGTRKAVDFSGCKSILCVTSLAFDIFGLESVYALNQGFTVYLAGELQRKNSRALKKFITDNNIDCIQMTPSRLKILQFVDRNFESLKNVKVIIVGGEDFPSMLLGALQEQARAKIYNAYGPTEATIWVSYSNLTDGDINIGMPMEGTRFYILDETGKPVEDESAGELCLGGNNLAIGYYGNEKETATRFHFSPECGERIYRTGDLCKKKDGYYYWLGRLDNQVKVNGHRIELEEVEKTLRMYSGVSEAAVHLHVDEDVTKQYMVAVVTVNEGYDEKECRRFLGGILPEYMIPHKFVKVDKFLYTISGKIDRKAIRKYIEDKNVK